jgi:DNA polymerase III delta prime subunit
MKKILILASNPRNDLKLEREIKDMKNVIKRSKNQSQFETEFELEVHPEELHDLFLEHEPRIVHFCGHGTGEQGLVLQNQAGREQVVSTEALSNLFELFDKQVEGVLLNACYSEVQANAIVQHINYVVGMSDEISDDAAIAFATGFYRALGWGKSIEEAYKFGRNAIQIQIAKANTSRSRSSGASRKLVAVDVAEQVIIPEHFKPVLKRKSPLTLFPSEVASAPLVEAPNSSTQSNIPPELIAAVEEEERYKQYRERTRETWDEFGQSNLVERKPISQNEYRQRQTLLNKVKQFWLEGFLKPSLYGNSAINLDWKTNPDALLRPFEGMEEIPVDLDESFEGLQPTKILNQTELGKTLLILGEPGSGKTITLLQLAKKLVNQTEQDLTLPIPVVFNLSSWGQKQQPIEKWLIEELKDKYQVPKTWSEPWLKQEQLILLLDGLDEVQAKKRNACVKALNQFIATHNLTEMVVCSRVKDYEALTERLQLSSAICIKPLSQQQVYSFLTKAGDSLAGLKTLLQRDRELEQFTQTPLILNIMSLAYQGWSAEKLLQQFRTSEERYRHLFDSYIERMLRRKVIGQLEQNPNSTQYPQEKVLHWLSCLAQRLSQASQTVFLIEQIQPTWLPKDSQRAIYSVGVSLTVGLTAAVFHVGPLSSVFEGGKGLVEGLMGGVIAGLFYGLLGGLISRWLSGSVARLATGLTLGLLFGLVFWLVLGPKFGLTYGLFYAICGVIIYEFLSKDIEPVDTLEWSWQKALKNLGLALIFVLILSVTNGLIFGLIFGLLLWLILSWEKQTEINRTTRPNQGIWKSVQDTIKLTAIIGLFAGIFLGVIQAKYTLIPEVDSFVLGLANGIMFGYGAALLSTQGAGFVCFKHLILRLLLWRSGYTPWNSG